MSGPGAARRVDLAVGHLVLSGGGFVAAATTLVEVERGLYAFLLFVAATWFAVSELANVLDNICDVAWDWQDDDGTPRRPAWSDRLALGTAARLGDLADRLDRPAVHEPITVGHGIEVVEILDDPFRP
ncbi:MAG: hypothetical protein AAFZ07_07730 [Actinomycetota bacterium]